MQLQIYLNYPLFVLSYKPDVNDTYLRRKFCCSKVHFSNMGQSMLESHMQGVKQTETLVKSGCIFKTVRKTTSDSNVNTATSL